MSYTVLVEDAGDIYEPHRHMKIFHNNKCIQTEYDGGEPEDNSFTRDWSWIQTALKTAYELGYKDCRIDYNLNNSDDDDGDDFYGSDDCNGDY